MLKKSESSFTPGSNNNEDKKKKQKIIKWDEVTIAEHDKERGSR
jgi:hypothetical protein